ncbi:MAG: DUF433 domain-containing protein [Micrococcales bacterium]|nr:DUF433 domain-containing protein [Micrococcales bacterium]
MAKTDERYTVPLYTIGLAASHLGMKPATLGSWVNKKELLTSVPAKRPFPQLPFMGLVEAQVCFELRRAGLSMQAITGGMRQVRQRLGSRMLLEGVLAHDGKNILMNLAKSGDPEWTRAIDLQGGLPQVIEIGLRLVTWDSEGIPQTVRLSAYQDAVVTADPRYAFGQPVIQGTTVRVEDVLSLFKAGDPIETVCAEMDIPQAVVESIVRTHVALAA